MCLHALHHVYLRFMHISFYQFIHKSSKNKSMSMCALRFPNVFDICLGMLVRIFINMIVVHAHSQYLAHVLLQALVHIILNDLIQQIYIEGCVQQTHISNRRKTISSRCRLKHKHIKHKDSYANHCRNMRKHTQNIINLCKTSRIMRLKI